MADGLKKIDLTVEDPPQKEIAVKKPRKFYWSVIGVPLAVLLLVAVVVGILLLPFGGIVQSAKTVMGSGRELGTAAKNQDLEKAKAALSQTRNDLTKLRDEYGKVLYLKYVPFLGAYIRDGEHLVNAGFGALEATQKAIEALEPNADLLGLKGTSTFVAGSADDRIQTAVKTMTALTPKINDMAIAVDRVRSEVDAIDPDRYPKSIGKTLVRERIESAKDVVDNAANLFVNAQPLLINLPKLLGDPKEKRYLVLFQNDKELRATGGFITAYAQFRFVRGKAILEKADDIYAMDNALSKKFPAPPEITKFHKGVYNLNIRDSNLSPDLLVSMGLFEDLYASVGGKEKIDGIWLVDTHVLVEAL